MKQVKVNINSTNNTTLTASEIETMYEYLGNYTDDSNIVGNATAMKAYKTSVEALKKRFPRLNISVMLWYLVFEDLEVIRILSSNFGDGLGLTDLETNAINNISTLFKGNNKVQSGKDLVRTTIAELVNSAFENSSFKYLEFPRTLNYLGNNVFKGCNSRLIVVFNSKVAAKQHLDFTLGSEPESIYVLDADWQWFINESNLKQYKHLIDPLSDLDSEWLEFSNGQKIRFSTELTILI